ncbi:hypothetical protein Tco_1094931, partial [Tanacetum coccineum]
MMVLQQRGGNDSSRLVALWVEIADWYDMVLDEEAGTNSPRKKQRRHHELDDRYEQRKDHCTSFASLLSVDAHATNLVVAQNGRRAGIASNLFYLAKDIAIFR